MGVEGRRPWTYWGYLSMFLLYFQTIHITPLLVVAALRVPPLLTWAAIYRFLSWWYCTPFLVAPSTSAIGQLLLLLKRHHYRLPLLLTGSWRPLMQLVTKNDETPPPTRGSSLHNSRNHGGHGPRRCKVSPPWWPSKRRGSNRGIDRAIPPAATPNGSCRHTHKIPVGEPRYIAASPISPDGEET